MMNYNPYLMQTQNPYISNYQYQPQPQVQGIQGRMVNAFNEITANDVPMTGGCAYFPKADGSEISVRKWNNNGTISQTVYKPYIEPVEDNTDNLPTVKLESLYKTINDRLDRIERMLVPWRKGDDYDTTRIDTENNFKQQPDNAEPNVR